MRAVTVLDPGVLTTVQDGGRPGFAHLGVPCSGWLDPAAALAANRLVGNPDDAAVLEVLLGGLVVRVEEAMTVAVTGAGGPLAVNGRSLDRGLPLSLGVGDTLAVGPADIGLRCYVALSGGVEVEPVLGSRSTDTLSGLGPKRLAKGDVLAVGEPSGTVSSTDHPVLARPPRELSLECTAGPRADWFEPEALRTLTASAYTVLSDSDRVGLRLDGNALQRRTTDELPSEGIVLGAVQVPANGLPLVFLNDHPTTGGYPVIAVVSTADVRHCAQLRPGDTVRFSLGAPRSAPATRG